ncbi:MULTISPECIES: protein meaA [unclassified Hyphomonas]|jgi:(2R)-ethylmalonyl-CoA mutase|uniref:protein meaA n=1 Tax=unclassified Hyphomonas TaxID=2630699 RepID=UPI000C395684|nr:MULTISPECIES: protein meaA [unclassified Hyphomonas]MAL44003.1 protein meaA [Hyphomonas sp.]MAX84391.1 protein meaA [Hyphomonas sp.]HAW56132.1 protein meaA [Hyphomonas sp.]HBJ42716.1 protein meaA [Hyphomonas sp.]HBN91502.1 protein meaA [Hyphomonas sp.]|tara:strand:+ start:3271 stop:5256 length:1986 start_codon:yes stop_codon:yes gene_type:complete
MDKAYQHAPDRPWIFRTYAGHSTATKSNELYRGNLAKGQTGLSIAFDLPTQTAYDADHILSKGEVGKVGVPVKHLGDMRLLFDQLPLEEMNTSMTINAPAAWMLALYVALADERGDDRKKLRGTTQNDIVKEYLSRGTYVFPPEPSLRLISDMVSWCYTEVPKWNPMNVCSYHLQEAGATPEQELAYALATAISVLDTVKAGGQVPESDFETVFGRISFFVNAGVRFVTELCKMRAFVELWEEIGRERYGVTSPKALLFRYGVQVNSLGLTEPQPENNVYRILIEAMAVTLSKKARCRALQLPAWNEALGLPRPWDQQWSLRLQQILAYETDLLEYEDIFDGSHVIESKTEELKALARDTLADLDARGGAIQSIDHMKESLVGAHIDRIKAIESGDLTVVGVNRYVETAESPLAGGDGSIQTVDPAEESAQVRDLKEWRSKRDASAVENALAALKQAAQDGTNIMEPSIACAKAGVTTGEWGTAMRDVFGEFRAPTGVAMVIKTDGEEDAAAVRKDVERVSEALGRQLTYVLGKPGLDGHSNGAEQIAARGREVGMNVVYEGIRFTPSEIAAQAKEANAHVVGLSILSGSHLDLVRETIAELRAVGLGDVPVVIGGIIPPEDARALRQMGIARVYTPKDFKITEIMGDVVGIVEKAWLVEG